MTIEVARRTIRKPSDREDWLTIRRPFFNASATSVLFDRHPYLSPGDYATTKLTGVEQTQTKAMRRGIALEDAIAQWWALEHACSVGELVDLYVANRVMATVDRWALDDDCPIEIKTASFRAFEPERYWLDQCQSLMLCTDRDACWLVWLDPSMDLHERLVHADPELQAEILTGAERFMAAIDMGIVPDWIQLSYQNVARLYPSSAEGRSVEMDDDGLSLVQALAMVRDVKRDAERDEGEIKDSLAKLLLDCEAATYDGQTILTWRTSKPTMHLDVEMLEADHPDLVEKYRRERPGSRRMLTKLDAG